MSELPKIVKCQHTPTHFVRLTSRDDRNFLTRWQSCGGEIISCQKMCAQLKRKDPNNHHIYMLLFW